MASCRYGGDNPYGLKEPYSASSSGWSSGGATRDKGWSDAADKYEKSSSLGESFPAAKKSAADDKSRSRKNIEVSRFVHRALTVYETLY